MTQNLELMNCRRVTREWRARVWECDKRGRDELQPWPMRGRADVKNESNLVDAKWNETIRLTTGVLPRWWHPHVSVDVTWWYKWRICSLLGKAASSTGSYLETVMVQLITGTAWDQSKSFLIVTRVIISVISSISQVSQEYSISCHMSLECQ